MANSKRPDKINIEVVKALPGNLHFAETIGTRGISIYVKHITEALNAGGAILIKTNDAYMRQQLKKAAKKLNLRLLLALDGEKLYIKPIALDGEMKRLLLFLREPRTENELMSKKLELHLKNALAKLASDGLAHVVKERWVLTEKGMDAL